MEEATNSASNITNANKSSAKALYSRLESDRFMSLQRARDCSALTLPGLLPPIYATENTELPTPYQSVGARGVNNLSSKLLMALFPPGMPCFRLKIREAVAQSLGQSLSAIQSSLGGVERTVNDAMEQGHTRPLMAEVLKHLIVAGNALMHVPDRKNMRMFRMDQYVIARDNMGRPLRTVVYETTVVESLTEEVSAACKVDRTDPYAKVDIYTMVDWDYDTAAGSECSWQEINDIEVPGSRTKRPLDKAEWLPLRWISVPNKNYGRGHCEEYLGDLRSLEGLNEAIVQFSQAAAKIVMLVHPNSTTSVTDLNQAESGDAIVGSKADIDMLQLEKQADFQVADAVATRLEQRLSYAFLLTAGTTRNAERVTAEEIRANAQELEDALGGVYTVLAQELQLPLIRRLMASMQESREIPALPKRALDPVIVTGFEALGRNHEMNRLRSLFQDLTATFGPEVLAQRVNFNEVAKRFANGYGVEKQEDLWKSDDQVAQEQQQQQMAAGMQRAAPQIAKGVADKVNQQ
jgi:hypothetical protein